MRLNPEKAHRDTADKDNRPCDGMGIPPAKWHSESLQPDHGDRHTGQHCQDSDNTEDDRDREHERVTLLCSRIHEERNKRFAGPEDEDDEHGPGRY